jgi:hypothetical protein
MAGCGCWASSGGACGWATVGLIDEWQIWPLSRLQAPTRLIGCFIILRGIETPGWWSAASCLMLAATLKLQHLLVGPAHTTTRSIPIVLSRTSWELFLPGPAALHYSMQANPRRITTILPSYPPRSPMLAVVASSFV